MSVKIFSQNDTHSESDADGYSTGQVTPVQGNIGTAVGNKNIADAQSGDTGSTIIGIVPTPGGKDKVKNNDGTIVFKNPPVDPKIFSKESGAAPFETFFNAFDIEAFPVYNFWVPDELSNDRDPLGKRNLADVPRYIRLVWNVAPVVQSIEKKLEPKTPGIRKNKEIIFSRESDRPTVFRAGGIEYTPEHLQSTGFSKIKTMTANGFLSPGVVEAIVEIPLANAGIESNKTNSQDDSIFHIDEDAFLTNSEFDGLSIQELKGQLNQISNGLSQDEDSQFSVRKSLEPGGEMKIVGIQSSSPTITMSVKTASPARKEQTDDVLDMLRNVSQPESISRLDTSIQCKVKFVDTSISGIIGENKTNLISSPEQLESTMEIAKTLPNLEILSKSGIVGKSNSTIPSIPSPGVETLEYIGYVIEKYKKRTSGNGSMFVKVDEIDITSREINSYVDTKVLYGEIYRYRIKAIVRWCRESGENPDGKDKTGGQRKSTSTQATSKYFVSFFNTEWSNKWAYGSAIDDQPPPPPDELVVRPDSPRKRVVVTFRLPENSQRDIFKMRLLKKTRYGDGSETEWAPARDSTGDDADMTPNNVIFFDTNTKFYQDSQETYLYCAQCISRHGEESYLSEQLAVRLNAEHFSRGEFPVRFVSSPGVRLEYYGAFKTRPFLYTKTEVIMKTGKNKKTSIRMSGRESMGNVMLDDGNYVIRVQSLDTGETADIPLVVKFQNLPTRQEVSTTTFYVPTHSVSGKNSDEYKVDRALGEELKKSTSSEVLSHGETEVFVYDRASKNDRW